MATFFFWVFVVLFTPLIVAIAFKVNQAKSQKKNIEAFMAKNDFEPEYFHPYSIALDSKTRRIIFATDNNSYTIYDLRDVKYLEKYDRGGTTAAIHQIIFTVKDLDQPRINIRFKTFKERNVWYDRVLMA
uniref:hypothetical protein n=1 Tax=Psychrobacter sp. TaxID=56811 RepID=UPI00159A2239|nr:hypothetical protein [Psychrobacter sp.]QJS05343.1 hypothetical protein [Psychrobacter sp.]